MSNLTIYLTGAVFVAGGLSLTSYKLGASSIWIGIVFLITMGLGIMVAVSKTRQKEKSNAGNEK